MPKRYEPEIGDLVVKKRTKQDRGRYPYTKIILRLTNIIAEAIVEAQPGWFEVRPAYKLVLKKTDGGLKTWVWQPTSGDPTYMNIKHIRERYELTKKPTLEI